MARAAFAARPKSGETARRLLEAARDLMAERGSLDVSIVEISKRADANVALVSYYFKGREGLMVALARSDADFALVRLERLMAAPLPPTEKLRLHILGVVRIYAERPYLNRLLHMIMREGSHEAAAAVADFFVRPLTEARVRIIEDGVASGDFRPVDARIVGFAIDGACEHIFASREARAAVLGDGEMTERLRESHAETIAALFVRGLGAPEDDKAE